MKIFNLTAGERRLFYITLAVVAIWFGQKYLFGPVWTKLQELDKEIGAKRVKLEKSELLISKEDAMSRDYAGLEAMLKVSGSKEEEMARFLTEIESLAETSAVRITEIKPLPGKTERSYEKFFAELELEGEMAQISRYISEIETSKNLLTIEKLSISAKQGGNNLLRCRLVISKTAIP